MDVWMNADYLCAGRVDHVRRFEHEQTRLFYFDARSRHIRSDRSKLCQLLAECNAIVRLSTIR
jgi:hypothetical protein